MFVEVLGIVRKNSRFSLSESVGTDSSSESWFGVDVTICAAAFGKSVADSACGGGGVIWRERVGGSGVGGECSVSLTSCWGAGGHFHKTRGYRGEGTRGRARSFLNGRVRARRGNRGGD